MRAVVKSPYVEPSNPFVGALYDPYIIRLQGVLTMAHNEGPQPRASCARMYPRARSQMVLRSTRDQGPRFRALLIK